MRNIFWVAVFLVISFLFGCNDGPKTPQQIAVTVPKPIELTGYEQKKDWAYQDSISFIEPTPEVLPDKFDIRDLMASAFPAPRQQQCGDCWAWSTHHAYEMAHMLVTGKFFDNSVQAVLSCSNEGSCGGGDMGAVDFLKHGLPLEADFPYKNGVTGRCKYTKAEITTGWDPKMVDTPYIGSSLSYSRSMKTAGGDFERRPSVKSMQTAMFKYKAPLVVTVDAYSTDSGDVIERCSSINGGGNHMVAIPGYDNDGGHVNAHVYNSWGAGHGKDGVSRIKWECGPGKLNRGLGVSAKVVIYKPECEPPHVDLGKATATILKGTSVKVGNAQPAGVSCQWSPADGVADPHACVTYVEPLGSTEYHLVAENKCGKTSAMKLIEVLGPTRDLDDHILTPSGVVSAR